MLYIPDVTYSRKEKYETLGLLEVKQFCYTWSKIQLYRLKLRCTYRLVFWCMHWYFLLINYSHSARFLASNSNTFICLWLQLVILRRSTKTQPFLWDMKLSCLISNDSGLLDYDAMLLDEWFLVVPYCARFKGYDHHRAISMEPRETRSWFGTSGMVVRYNSWHGSVAVFGTIQLTEKGNFACSCITW